LFGQKVLSINGLDPLSYLESQSAITGAYTQASTRINEVVATYFLTSAGAYGLNPGLLVNRAWPLEDSLTLVLDQSGTVVIPVLALPKGKWTNRDDYLSVRCVLKNGTVAGLHNTTSSARLRRRSTPLVTSDAPELEQDITIDDPFDSSTTNSFAATDSSSDIFGVGTPLSSGGGINTYQLAAPYQNIGVAYIGAFGSAQKFAAALLSGLNQMQSLGVTQLIIDVSGNGGGSVAGGQYLEQLLFPDKYPGFPSETRAKQIAVNCAANFANMGTSAPEYMYNYRAWCKVISH
jgi:hypothetical protein